jgi:hypothetical protein
MLDVEGQPHTLAQEIIARGVSKIEFAWAGTGRWETATIHAAGDIACVIQDPILCPHPQAEVFNRDRIGILVGRFGKGELVGSGLPNLLPQCKEHEKRRDG